MPKGTGRLRAQMRRSLRIVHVANFGFKPVKVYLHGVAAKLSNGWTRAGHHVVNISDRDLARWSALGLRAVGRSMVNKILLDYCTAVKPDVLVLGHADTIKLETVVAIRERLPSLRVMQWNVDWLLVSKRMDLKAARLCLARPTSGRWNDPASG